LDGADADMGGSTPTIIPDLDPATTSTPHLVAFGSKQGNIYLVDRDALPGGVVQRPSCEVETIQANNAASDPSLLPPDPRPYYGSARGPLNVFGHYSETCNRIDEARMRTTPAYFRGRDGTSYLFVSGAQKQTSCSKTPVAPGLARLAFSRYSFNPI
jgi:hypothetical protein